jgi:hypothetical protein
MNKKRGEDEIAKFFHSNFFPKNGRGQVTIFIIIGIIIVAAVVGFFLLRGTLGIVKIPASIEPFYNTFLSCLEDKTTVGISILESQGGYIELPDFEPGNRYMPFSSQLNFFGNPIPYWYYVSGNNIQKEQVPTESEMEKELANFIDERIRQCNYDNYYNEGFEIYQEEPKSTVDIKNDNVNVKLSMNMRVSYGEDTVVISSHNLAVKSYLGALYNSAKNIYQKEQRELFLENYGVDNLRLYAPVDGVEITCSPKTWDANVVFSDLQEAIETNTLALSTEKPTTSEEKYFFVDAGITGEARFINSRNWSNSFEVSPSEGSLLISNPVGNQPDLGILGFCYVPYHFVYNVRYPVLVQVLNGEETFQFPLAVVIQGNKPRVALNSTASAVTTELCLYKNTMTTVRTYDTNLNPVNSQISYECFGETCDIGETVSGVLTSQFPQCVNGFVVASAKGFEKARYQYSTNQEGSADIILNKLYNLNVALKLGGSNYNGKAMIYFSSEGNSKAISYPEQKEVELSEGQYEITVYVYKDSSIQLNGGTTKQCVSVPASGIKALFGLTEKKCFDIKIPSQILSSVLAGGGKQDYSILESELQSSTMIEIGAEEFPTPTTIEQVQNNYLAFDDSGLGVSFK